MTAIKICGVTRVADAAAIADLGGVTALGLNFWPGSRRFIELEVAAEIAYEVRGRIQLVGVFVDQDLELITTTAAAVGLDAVQLHGNETRDLMTDVHARTKLPVWKALAVNEPGDLTRAEQLAKHTQAVLLDAPGRGGTGRTFDWRLARQIVERVAAHPIYLAGGITPDNVAAALAQVAPFGIDLASGVESSPGIKDLAKVRALVAATRLP